MNRRRFFGFLFAVIPVVVIPTAAAAWGLGKLGHRKKVNGPGGF
jgi:hypothetical protein